MDRRSFRLCPVVAGLLLAIVLSGPALAQFGQNKISYESFDWQVYRAPHFDVHYYPSTEPFLEEVVSYAESAYLKISQDLDHELRFRVPLVIYKTHGEFQQTNIILAELPDGVGAFAEPVQYRMVLPIDLPPDELYELIAHELTHIFEYSYFFDGYLGRAIRARPPVWLMEGLASYLGEDEDNMDRMAIRDAVVNNILPPIEALNQVTFLTYRYGHAVFDFIEQEHGKEGVRSFLFEFKKVLLTGNLSKAIKESFGYDIDEFNRRFSRYLRQKYFPVLLEKKSPDDYGTELGQRKLRGAFVASPALSPSGELIAAMAAPNRMELDLVVLSAEDGSLVKNLTKGWTNDYYNLVTEVFSGKRDLSWSPTADHVAVFARRENKWPLLIFNALTGKKVREFSLDGIYQSSSPAFSPDGKRIAFEGNRDGIVDLFEVEIETGTIRNLTQDDFFDSNPWYAADGRTLLYNRRIGSHWKIFSVDLADATKKTQLTFGSHSDIQPSYSRDGQLIYFSSDRNEFGIFNLYSLDVTNGDIRQFTDVVGGVFAPVEMGERADERNLVFSAFYQGQFRAYRMPLRSAEQKIEAAERLDEPAEAEPFEPTIRLRTDEDKKERYKAKWDLDSPSFSVGVADDGTFLANTQVAFSDLLGNQRFVFSAASVADYQQYQGTYLNVRNRIDWGAQIFDYRDYFVDRSSGVRFERRYKVSGLTGFVQFPLSRYYRFETRLGVQDAGLNQLIGLDATGLPIFAETSDTLGIVGASFVGDTTRYQRWGPFQGKRFNVGVVYGPHISGDFEGDLTEWELDYRAYKQATRRSTLSWRIASRYSVGERQNTYGFGGLNQLRGWEFREFFGSRIVWSNLEFRFPLVDELRFPILALRDVRGLFFFDVGAAWFGDRALGGGLGGEPWYDPDFRLIRADYSQDPNNPELIPFDFWDSANNRLGDGRASYGAGFQFFFIGGLQFNWVWAKRMPYTQYVYPVNPLTGQFDLTQSPVPTEIDDGDTRQEFYIQFDW